MFYTCLLNLGVSEKLPLEPSHICSFQTLISIVLIFLVFHIFNQFHLLQINSKLQYCMCFQIRHLIHPFFSSYVTQFLLYVFAFTIIVQLIDCQILKAYSSTNLSNLRKIPLHFRSINSI